MKKRHLMFVALLAAMTFAGSAYASTTLPGTWDFNVESYVTDIGGGVWRYDYVLWYEQWNGTAWSAMGTDNLTYSNPSEFHVHVPVDNGIFAWADLPMTTPDNVFYNGAASWDFAFLGASSDPLDPGTIIAWDLTRGGNTRADEDTSPMVDFNVDEAYDPAVRDVTNDKEAILEAFLGVPAGSSVLFPGSPTPYDPTNSNMTAMTGYDRPLGWFEFLSTKPPGPTHGDTVDGSQTSDGVWGPTPEANSLSLLLMSLAPAGALLRRRRKR